MASDIEVPVLVVGAGPAGLSLGLELSRLGSACLVIDREDGVVLHPRGTGVSERTMEYFRRWCIVDEVRDGYNDDLPLNQFFCESLAGYEYGVARYPSLGEWPVPPESPTTLRRCSQDWWDRSIANALQRSANGRVWYHYEYRGIQTLDEHGYVVNLTSLVDESDLRVRTRYLVAADGIDSGIRDEVGIGKVDEKLLHYSMSIVFEAPELFEQIGREPGERFILVDENGPWGNVTSIDGRGVFRLLVRGGFERFDLDNFQPEWWVRRALGRADLEWWVTSVRPWRREQWLAETYRSGNVFLVGDAAHSMSSSGGHGANTGITDAVNLAWKLCAIEEGWGGEALLDSYENERRPVARRNIAFAERNTQNWSPKVGDMNQLLKDTPEGQRVRDDVGTAMRTQTRSEWESLGVKLGYRYDASPVVVPDGSSPPPDDARVYVPTGRPGSRAPHAWLEDGRSTLDLFGDAFVLLRFDETVTVDGLVHEAKQLRMPVDTADVRSPEAAALYESKLTLVRPDGHVAWRGDQAPQHPSELLTTVCGR